MSLMTRTTEPVTLTRSWVIWHLIEHALHGGEISLTLGMHELAAPALWLLDRSCTHFHAARLTNTIQRC